MNAQITVATSDGRSFVRPVDKDEFTVGRDSRNHLVLGDRQVSKFHCKILARSGQYIVQDLGSSNGTLINGIRMGAEVAISTGDRLRLGPYELIFATHGSDAEPRPPTPRHGTAPPATGGGRDDLPELELEDPLGGGAGPGATPPPGVPRAVQLGEPSPTPARNLGAPPPVSDSGVTPAASRAYLEIIDGDGKGHMITVGNRGVSIGAGSRNHLVLDDPFVSRSHCRVDMERDGYKVRDTGSTNGIRVDGQDVNEAPLGEGTRLQVGGVLMVFRWPDKASEISVSDLPVARARPVPGETITSPGAPVPGALQRPGRTTNTVRQMEALTESAILNIGPPETKTARKDSSKGAIAIGGLRFKKWQLAILGLTGAMILLAVLAQAAIYMIGPLGKTEETTTDTLYQAGLDAYTSGDWDTAEAYFSKIQSGDDFYEEATQYLASIRVEGENADRVDRIAILMKEYDYSKEAGFFERAYEIYKEIPANSRYYEEAEQLVLAASETEANRMLEEAVALMAAGDLDEAGPVLDRAAEYAPDSEVLAELREILAVDNSRTVKKMMKDRAKGIDPTAEVDVAADGGHTPRPTTPRSIQTVGKALETYLGGDVSGARSMLERAIDTSGDAAQKLELQDTLGRIDRIERAYSAGQKAMGAGELDTALDRFETSYRDVTRMDSDGKSARRNTVRQGLAECRYLRGESAFDRGKYAKANFEWRAGRKAWSGHSEISSGRDDLEAVAKDIYNDGYVAEKEGTERGRDEARRLYERVVAIAPQGDGYKYYDKATARLAEL
jgi:pSer/pThr/pTyr-binding forkhead associated (FHA) protein/tetratricopeptide (TPR) repeat protein